MKECVPQVSLYLEVDDVSNIHSPDVFFAGIVPHLNAEF